MSQRHRLIEALRLPVHGRVPIRRSTVVLVVALVVLAVLYGSIHPSSSSPAQSSNALQLCNADKTKCAYIPAPATPTTQAPKTTPSSTIIPSPTTSTTSAPSTTTTPTTTTSSIPNGPGTTGPSTAGPSSTTTTTTMPPGGATTTSSSSTSSTSSTTRVP